MNDVTALLTSPTFAFGIVLEPEDETVQWIKAFNYIIPEKFWYYPLALQLEAYETFFDWLEKHEHVKKSTVMPTIVPIVDWLHTQKVVSREMRMEYQNECLLAKCEKIFPFVRTLFPVLNT